MLHVNKKNATVFYTIIQSLYFFISAMVYCYASAYLLHRGLSNSQIGIAVGVSCILSALLQPAAAILVDRSRVRLGSFMAIMYAAFALGRWYCCFYPCRAPV